MDVQRFVSFFGHLSQDIFKNLENGDATVLQVEGVL